MNLEGLPRAAKARLCLQYDGGIGTEKAELLSYRKLCERHRKSICNLAAVNPDAWVDSKFYNYTFLYLYMRYVQIQTPLCHCANSIIVSLTFLMQIHLYDTL